MKSTVEPLEVEIMAESSTDMTNIEHRPSVFSNILPLILHVCGKSLWSPLIPKIEAKMHGILLFIFYADYVFYFITDSYLFYEELNPTIVNASVTPVCVTPVYRRAC